MKTIVVAPAALLLTTIGALSTPAHAGKRTAPKPRPAPALAAPVSDLIAVKEAQVKFNFGETYGLKAKSAAPPSGEIEEAFEARSVTESQVSKVVKDRVAELEYCWLRLPAAKRVAASASLKLMIEPSGAVAGAFLEGSVPAGVSKCIETVASKWTFPVADAGCEIEHALSLNGKSDSLR